MGKSDSLIFPEYAKILFDISYRSIAFLGFSSENPFTEMLNGKERHFYDLSIGNWDINTSWTLKQKYDLIVCTRCAYFSKFPDDLIARIKEHLNSGGHALVDWGLGDHWRFQNYKIGWLRDGEQEYAYSKNNFLYSCYWNDKLYESTEVQAFWNAVKNNEQFKYSELDSLDAVVRREVPSIVDYEYKKIVTKFLWPESPQLYIITLIAK